MRDLGILMTPANREAIVEGRKTMTRRRRGLEEINKDPDAWFYIDGEGFYCADKRGAYNVLAVKPPYAKGQRLYLKEPHYRYGKWLKNGLTKKTERQAWKFKSYGDQVHGPEVFDFPDTERGLSIHPSCDTYRDWSWYKRLARFMPKKFARTWLLVTDVKAPERVQDISDEDAIAEGALFGHDPSGKCNWADGFARACFCKLWESIYGEGSWDKNEWVWTIEFKKIDKE